MGEKEHLMAYDDGYPTRPIGGGNPYHCCAYCGRSVPSINGDLDNHFDGCEYVKVKKLELEVERLNGLLKEATTLVFPSVTKSRYN